MKTAPTIDTKTVKFHVDFISKELVYRLVQDLTSHLDDTLRLCGAQIDVVFDREDDTLSLKIIK